MSKKLRAVVLLAFILSFYPFSARAQQTQTTKSPIAQVNARWVQGRGEGFWPTPGVGLVLNLSPGTCFDGSVVPYAGGSLTLTNTATNYVYLDSTCTLQHNTTGFAAAEAPIAVVVAAGGVLTTITDDRTSQVPSGSTYTGTSPIIVSGTVISCPTCRTGPNVNGIGSLIGGIMATGSNIQAASFTSNGTTSFLAPTPVGMFVRNPCVYIPAAEGNGLVNRYTLNQSDASADQFGIAAGYWNLTFLNATAAGGYCSPSFIPPLRVNQFQTWNFTQKNLFASGSEATTAGWSAETVTDNNSVYIGTSLAPTSSTSNVNFFNGVYSTAAAQLTTEARTFIVMPAAGTLQNFLLTTGAAPANATTCLEAIRVAGSTSALTFTLGPSTPGPPTGQYGDVTHTVSVTEGQTVNEINTSSLNGSNCNIQNWYVEFVPTTAGQFIIGGAVDASTADGVTTFSAPFTEKINATETALNVPMARSVTISHCHAYMRVAGSSGATLTLTLRKNGADTSQTIAISAGTTGDVSDTTHSVVYSQTDFMSMKLVESGGGTPGTLTSWACRLE